MTLQDLPAWVQIILMIPVGIFAIVGLISATNWLEEKYKEENDGRD